MTLALEGMARRAAGPRGRTVWLAAPLAAAGLVLLPLLALGWQAAGTGTGALAHLARAVLRDSLLQTGLLLAGVSLLVVSIGVVSAVLVSLFEFPGRRALSWALVLPLAIPTYIAAYAWVETFDYFGPVQTALRQIAGYTSRRDYWFPEVRSLPGAAAVVGFVLYPYVYLAARAALSLQSGSLLDAARMLGASRSETVLRVALPVAAPAVAAGTALALLETLNDIGGTQYLGVQTMTVAVFNTWLVKSDLPGAAVLALAMLGLVALIATAAARAAQAPAAASSRQARRVTRQELAGWRGALAALLCALPPAIGFAIPGLVLAHEAWRQWRRDGVPDGLLPALATTVGIGLAATALVLALTLAVAIGTRFAAHPASAPATRIARMGYALPGTVLVIGLLPVLGLTDRLLNAVLSGWPGWTPAAIVSGSVLALLVAYAIRFLAVAEGPVRNGLAATSENIDCAALILGRSRPVLATAILVPAILPALAAAAITVFVDVIKELPATLLLRPLNLETLATLLYGHAARGSFEDGAMAALLIVLAGLLPLLVLNPTLDSLAERRRAG
jgi:iron(III) transport system permease protein